MDDGSKRVKSTGYIPPIGTGKGGASVLPNSTGKKGGSPVYPNAPTKDGLQTTGGELTSSQLLAVSVMMGDFKELKTQMPMAWQASSKGKIYWCAEMPGHKLVVIEGKLLVDGMPIDAILDKLLAEGGTK